MICTVDIGIHNGVVVIESLTMQSHCADQQLAARIPWLAVFFRDKLKPAAEAKPLLPVSVAVVHVAQIKAIQGMTKEYEKVEAV